ncbi:MAG: altronate dehydrogenase [Planctomycetota bacterium]|nr:altronate dehydrogenase [Planctomycetota bacterium]
MNQLAETVLQFGAGRFLRGFVDRFIHQANQQGQNVGRIVIVQATPGARANLLAQQAGIYNALYRGVEDGEIVDKTIKIESVSRALVAGEEWPEILRVATSAHLKYIITNATEAGYATDGTDKFDDKPPKSLPGKLAAVLWARYKAGGSPLVLLPCELIERNADKVSELVIAQAISWNLPSDFISWVTGQCWWLNNLVDCIITDGPADHPLALSDKMMIAIEPYALFAIEKPARGMPPIFTSTYLHVVDDLSPFFLRKVRILNAVHSCMVAKFYGHGFETVQQVMADRVANRWCRDVVFEEIVPALVARVEGVAEFADMSFERFRNPFQVHLLKNISMNHDAKLQVRIAPTIDEFTTIYRRPPKRLMEVFHAKIPS